jgi:hypothetical protein
MTENRPFETAFLERNDLFILRQVLSWFGKNKSFFVKNINGKAGKIYSPAFLAKNKNDMFHSKIKIYLKLALQLRIIIIFASFGTVP